MSDYTDHYLDPFGPLLEAMIQAEGGTAAFVRAVQCSMPGVTTFDEACARACKTLRNKVATYGKTKGMPLTLVARRGIDPWTAEPRPKCLVVTKDFLRWFATTWAPRGVANDPTDLNANWPRNVMAIYAKLNDLNAEEWP